MLRFFARSSMPLMTAATSLAPIVQAVQRTTHTDNSYPSLENVFAAPESSSALVEWMLSGRLGDCLEWLGETGASLGREFVLEQPIREHKEQLKFYAARLTHALVAGDFNEENTELDDAVYIPDLIQYVYHAKQLVQKTNGDVAQEIEEQLGIFCTLTNGHTQTVVRSFQELRKGLAEQYSLTLDIFPASSHNELRLKDKPVSVKRTISSKKQRSQTGIDNEADKVLRQISSNSPLAEIGLVSLNGINGFALTGDLNGDESGWSVSSAGDVNGDGIGDVVIGAPFAGANSEGKSYVVFGRVFEFDALMSLSHLDGTNGFALTGKLGDLSGSSVSGAGDVNGDGIDDVIIGAPFYDDNGIEGKSYVVFGRVSGFSAKMSLANLNGTNGFVLTGEVNVDGSRSLSGYAVSSAGDVNGDGVDDMVIGAYYVGNGAGKSYVIFGNISGFDVVMSLSNLSGTNGFVLIGENGDGSGRSVSGVGDVNGDGIDDVVIGAPNAGNYTGKSYVVFGSISGFDAVLFLANLNGTNGFVVMGEAAGDRSGFSVSGAGDVNRDGIDDVLIGAHGYANFKGKSYVVFGRKSGFDAVMSLASLNGANGFALIGEDGSSDGLDGEAGWSVSGAGDVNGDGIDDVLVGAPFAGDNRAGKSYVVFGSISGFDANIPLANLNGTNGFALIGENGDEAGWSVSGAGDVNGDGIDDMVIGAPFADNDAGKSYVVFGELIQISAPPIPTPAPAPAPPPSLVPTPSVFSLQIELSDLNEGKGTEFMGDASYDNSGWSVSSAGDVNGDGLSDVMIGAPYASSKNKRSGKSYVIFGNASNSESFLNISSFNDMNGFLITGEFEDDYAGWSVSTAGDVNADGVDDVIIGAFRASNSTRTGKGYVVFGKRSSFEPVLALASLNGTNGFVLAGEAALDGLGYSVSSAGDVNGDKVDDVTIGAPFASANGLRSGKIYVIFGKSSDFSPMLNLSNLNGTNGFLLTGEAASDRAGYTVSGAGDVNGDGIDDVIIGAPYAVVAGSITGKAYVVFGKKSSSFVSPLALSSLNGENGFVVMGEAVGDYFGFSVSGAGDMNGDRIDDVIIGAPRAGLAGSITGKSYVIFGQSSGFVQFFNLANLNGRNGFVVTGAAAGDKSGYSVKGAGDVDGDGFDDVIIGSPYAANNGTKSGKAYVIYGGSSKFPASIDLSLPNTAQVVLIGEANGDRAGWSVSGAGDFNGDKIDDVIIGAPHADPESTGMISAGKSYVVFGVPAPPSPSPSSLSGGQIAGIAVGGAVGLALVAAIAKFGIWDKVISPAPAPARARAIMP